LLAWLLVWLIIASAVALLLFRRATRTLQLNGG